MSDVPMFSVSAQQQATEVVMQVITSTSDIDFGSDDVVEVIYKGRVYLAEVGPAGTPVLTVV